MMFYAGVSGGAMFVPDDIERRCNSRKYQDMILAVSVPKLPAASLAHQAVKPLILSNIQEAA